MKCYQSIVGGAAVLVLHSSMAFAGGKCDSRQAALNDRFTSAYVSLESECVPLSGVATGSSDLTSSYCGPVLSPECQEKYNVLNAEVSEAWEAFYKECPDYFFPVANSKHSLNNSERASDLQVMGAPSKSELLSQVKKLKRELRREKRNQRKLVRQCRK